MSVRLSHLIFSLLFVACGLSLSACSTTTEKATCEERDWYEAGRRDGSQGATLDHFSKAKASCGEGFNAAWETMYTNGRNAGLVEYCSPENSYELGRMGLAYMYVCPSTVESEFLAGYRRGQKARELELQNQKIDAEIDTVLSRLNQENSTYSRRELASELEQLRKLRSKNERDLNKISN